MLDFALDLIKLLIIFALSVYTLEALIILGAFVYWFVQYKKEARRGSHS